MTGIARSRLNYDVARQHLQHPHRHLPGDRDRAIPAQLRLVRAPPRRALARWRVTGIARSRLNYDVARQHLQHPHRHLPGDRDRAIPAQLRQPALSAQAAMMLPGDRDRAIPAQLRHSSASRTFGLLIRGDRDRAIPAQLRPAAARSATRSGGRVTGIARSRLNYDNHWVGIGSGQNLNVTGIARSRLNYDDHRLGVAGRHLPHVSGIARSRLNCDRVLGGILPYPRV